MPCISTWIQVPAGVSAFQEAISSVASNPTGVTGEVQVPYSQVRVVPVCGSAYSMVPAGRARVTPARAPGTTRVPARLPRRQSAGPDQSW